MHRRSFAKTLMAASAALTCGPLLAQAWPARTIEWIVPYAPGGGTDIVARAIAQAMVPYLGNQNIVVRNQPGAATNIGADALVRAKPDGYTIMSADTATLAANPFLYPKLSFRADKDMAPVGLTVRFPLILVVNPSVPVKTLTQFRQWARDKSDGVNFASPGSGSPHHLAAELFKDATGLKMVHLPYRGAAPAVQDVLTGHVPMMFVDTAVGYQHIKQGKLVPIGVASARRVKGFEEVPTLAEQGLKGFEAYAWQGVVAPAGTPPEVIRTLNQALVKAMDSTGVKARLQVLGLEAITSSPEAMAEYAASERSKWSAVIRAADIRVE